MSNIGDYQALVAALSISFTSQASEAIALTAKDATALGNSVQAGALPVRLLLPYSDRERLSAEMGEPEMGNLATIRWFFTDQLLWRPLPHGFGLSDSAYDLREYCSAYMTAALSLDASSISDRMALESVRAIAREDINFPRGSDNWYIGVDVTWTIREDDPL